MLLTDVALLPSVLRPYTGGYTVMVDGYVLELCPDHPRANRFGFVAQHRLVVERHLGRYLKSSTHVHHRDENRSNNAFENLQPMSRREHMALHRSLERERKYGPLTEERVRQALREGGLKAAAKALGCHTETIRNNFPALVQPYKRRSPTQIDDPAVIAKVIELAADPNVGYREAATLTGMYWQTVLRICARRGVAWVRKSRKGEIHRTYRRKSANLAA